MGDKFINEPTASPDSAPEKHIYIPRDLKTAPEVSPELLKKIESEDTTKSAELIKPEATLASTADKTIDQAIEDIVAVESDQVLASEDEKNIKAQPVKPIVKSSKFKHFFKNKWLWIGLATILVAIFAMPVSRYAVLGLVVKHDVVINVKDSQTANPVSNASVTLNGKMAKTDAYGKTTIKAPIGNTKLSISKQYFKAYSANIYVGFKSAQTTNVSLVATGRQVPITVVDTITNKPLVGAKVDVLDTTVTTDLKGMATVVLPTKNATEKAIVTLAGYNNIELNIEVTDKVSLTNSLHLTPVGSIYFLSNLSGKIDVIKTNLDGSDRQTVLAGTGKEDPNNISLLASRDWHYLVLKAERDTPQAALYLIDTSSDKVTNFDSGDVNFSLIGWSGHSFLYDAIKNTVPSYQTGHESLKGYNADNTQLNLLDQNLAEGSASSYSYQSFYNFNVMNGQVTYNTQWNPSNNAVVLTGKTDAIRGIFISTQTKKDYQTIAAAGVSYIQAVMYKPQNIYYSVYNYTDSKTTYYSFDGQNVTLNTAIDQAALNRAYPAYIVSPSGNQLFWTELRDGKNYMYVGDPNAAGAKQLANLTDYRPYGWFSDNYLIVSSINGSELYILPTGSLATDGKLLKISDYYKSYQNLSGYSYGGL